MGCNKVFIVRHGKKGDLGILDPEEHLLNWGTFQWRILRNRIQLVLIWECEVFFISWLYNFKIILFPHKCSNQLHNRVPECFSAEILFSEDNARVMHVQTYFPVYLRTFEEHLKRQIQDPRNIEHFFSGLSIVLCTKVYLDGKWKVVISGCLLYRNVFSNLWLNCAARAN